MAYLHRRFEVAGQSGAGPMLFAFARRVARKIADAPAYLRERCAALVYFRPYKIGRGRAIGRPVIVNDGSLTIGDHFRVRNSYIPAEIACAAGATIIIGHHVELNYGTLISARCRVTIGSNVMIGNLSVISDSMFPLRPGQLSPEDDLPEDIEIGDEVWIAARVTVLPGARIGRGAVIGAGSIVSGVIPPDVIAMGNPARPVSRVKVATAASSRRQAAFRSIWKA